MKTLQENSLLRIMGLAFLVFSTSVHAVSVEAPGKVFYKMPDGSIVKRDVSLVVPAMGQGDVILKYGKDKEAKSAKFWTTKKFGKTTFNVLFKEIPGAPKDWAALYTGAYLRGTNAAYYYGDVYSIALTDVEALQNQSDSSDASGSLDAALDKVTRQYVGGFGFKAEIKE